jgi:EAL domain-containing protein (putative c-di-GMP-specific phosphodiesterase class I)
MARALQRGELFLVYQPQLDVRKQRVIGVEALLRWAHPEKGTLLPGQFIPVAEETGLIVPVGEWVLRSACSQMAAWKAQGLGDLVVAVNVSVAQFIAGTLSGKVACILAETGLAPESLEVEITESIAMARAETTISTLHALTATGTRLSIDDFGTGYSSLSQLQCCPVSKLKIDRSFVQNLTFDTTDKAIVRAIIFLGHSLDMRVIAEGVETEAQLALLKAYECDEIQGFLIARPMPVGNVPAAVRGLNEAGTTRC